MPAPAGPGPLVSDDVVRAVAEDRGVDAGDLGELVARHQRSVRSLPGVDDLVYEWRKQFDGAVLERSDSAYYLSVPDWVWGEFGESLEAPEAVTDALAAVHQRTVEERENLPDEPGQGRTFVVLDRRERPAE